MCREESCGNASGTELGGGDASGRKEGEQVWSRMCEEGGERVVGEAAAAGGGARRKEVEEKN